MTDEEFKKHLHKQLSEDKKNQGILTTQIYKNKKTSKVKNEKYNQKNPN